MSSPQHLSSQHHGGSFEPVFSPSWKTREACLLRLRKTVIPILAPTSKSNANGNLSQSSCRDIVGACLGVVAYSLADPVVKVYLAAVVSGRGWSYWTHPLHSHLIPLPFHLIPTLPSRQELFCTLLSYCVCQVEEEQTWLRNKLRPVVSVLLTRCTDAQRFVLLPMLFKHQMFVYATYIP